jgi:IS605 OrfB family transposase
MAPAERLAVLADLAVVAGPFVKFRSSGVLICWTRENEESAEQMDRNHKAGRERSGGHLSMPEGEATSSPSVARRTSESNPATTLPAVHDLPCDPEVEAKRARRAELKAARKKLMTRGIRCELLKPIDMTWDEGGALLRALRRISHRLVNASTFESVMAEREKRTANTTTAVREEERSIREYYATQVPLLEKRIASITAGVSRKDGTLHTDESAIRYRSAVERDLREAKILAGIDVPSAIVDAVTQKGASDGIKFFKARGTARMPSAKLGAPIYIRNRGLSLRVGEKGGVDIGLRITGGRTGFSWWALRPHKAAHWETIRDLVDSRPDVTLGDVKVVLDDGKRFRDRKGKWYAIISYSEPKPPPAAGSGTMAVHRGIYNFLTYASDDGHFGCLARGNKLLQQKRALEARHRSARVSPYELGAGALGRGQKRRMRCYEAVGDKLARIEKSACQQTAAHVVRVAQERGCSRVVIEDYGGIEPNEERGARRFIVRFPFFQLKTAIEWACTKAGITMAEVPSDYIATTCPRCGAIDPASKGQHGVFHCKACGYDRPADYVSALHMLRRSGADMGTWDARFAKELKIAQQLSGEPPAVESSSEVLPKTKARKGAKAATE